MGSNIDLDVVMRDATKNVQSTDNDGVQTLFNVPWPEHPLFGADHAKWTTKLAERILFAVFQQRGMPEPSEQEVNIIKGAAMFHDLGRSLKPDQNWRQREPGHNKRSADLAEKVLLADDNWRFKQNTHREICKLILAHELPPLGVDDKKRPTDPFLIALWDAECLESSRFDPNTESGLLITKERFGQVISGWAQLPEHRQRWRNERWQRASSAR